MNARTGFERTLGTEISVCLRVEGPESEPCENARFFDAREGISSDDVVDWRGGVEKMKTGGCFQANAETRRMCLFSDFNNAWQTVFGNACALAHWRIPQTANVFGMFRRRLEFIPELRMTFIGLALVDARSFLRQRSARHSKAPESPPD